MGFFSTYFFISIQELRNILVRNWWHHHFSLHNVHWVTSVAFKTFRCITICSPRLRMHPINANWLLCPSAGLKILQYRQVRWLDVFFLFLFYRKTFGSPSTVCHQFWADAAAAVANERDEGGKVSSCFTREQTPYAFTACVSVHVCVCVCVRAQVRSLANSASRCSARAESAEESRKKNKNMNVTSIW